MIEISETVIENQQLHGEAFPLVLRVSDDKPSFNQSISWITSNKDMLLTRLCDHGAILFRGFPVTTDAEFDAFVASFNLSNFTYNESLSNAVRRARTERVFTANEAPPSVPIFLHHEMAQTPIYPQKLFFFCEQADMVGGETPICRSDVLLERLQKEAPSFVKSCEQKGLRYSNVMPAENDAASGQGRSWQSTLTAATASQAEEKLAALNYQWQWLRDGSLKVTTPVLSSIKTLNNGKRVFFNQLIAALLGWRDARNQAEKSVCFGDGSQFNMHEIDVLIRISDELTFNLQWQKGDVALLDNFLVMHGRKPYSGQRRVLASLVA